MEFNEIISAATTHSGLTCPSCGSHSFRKYGKCLGIQRYRCKNCKRCFKETVNTPLHWIHNKQKMIRYTETMREHLTIRKSATEIGISVNTSFCWRHKILTSFRSYQTELARSPAGACQINMPHSYKGKRTIPDRQAPPSRTILVTDARGVPCLQHMPSRCTALAAAKLLSARISTSAAIACKPAHLLTRAVRVTGCATIRHAEIRNKLVMQARAKQIEIEHWMERFHGVATKYLQQYWNWYRADSGIRGPWETFVTECFAHRHLQHYRKIIKE